MEAPRNLHVGQISSGAPGQGFKQPRVILVPSATALSGAMGANIPGSGEGTYLAAHRGENPTGGYSLAVQSARLEGDRGTVRLALREPPQDAIVPRLYLLRRLPLADPPYDGVSHSWDGERPRV